MRKSLAFIAILVGLFVSIYLTWAYTSPSHKMVCLGTGCDVVRSSEYAYPWGVPLPVFGLVFYAMLAALALAEPFMPSRGGAIWRAITVFSGVGVLFSAWLTYLEAYVIHGWCAWCVTQAIAIVVAFLLAVSLVLRPSSAAPGWRARYAIFAVAIVAAIPGMVFATRQHEAPPAPQQTASLPPGAGQLVRPDSHWTGNPDAKLTIVEFADFQCPSCGVAEKTNRAIRDQFGSKIKFVFRQFPLERIHAYAFQASKAAECAGQQDKFWPMAETLYTNQAKLTAPDLRQYAADLGLDQQKFNACLEDPKVSERIRTDIADAQALNVRATPTFFLNGKQSEGALDMMQVTAALSAANSQAPVAANQQSGAPAKSPEAKPGEKNGGTTQPGASAAAKADPSKTDNTRSHAATASEGVAKPGTAPTPAKDAKPAAAAANPLAASGAGAFSFGSGGCSVNPEPDPPMMHTEQVREMFEKKSATFVDVRNPDLFSKGRIPDAVNIPMDQFKQRMPELAKDKSFVLYEGGGSPGDPCALSKSAARMMIGSGFKQVHVFQEGLAGWRKDGLPTAP